MDLYGLLGYPLGHSFSAAYFTEKFSNLQIDARYCNFEYNSVEAALAYMMQQDELKGFNVTIPYKEKNYSVSFGTVGRCSSYWCCECCKSDSRWERKGESEGI